MKTIIPAILSFALIAGCGGSDDSGTEETTPAESTPATSGDVAVASEFTLVSPEEAATTIADPPADLVILDVRTPEEFAEGHIEGAVMVDFYSDTFDAELAALDTDVPYVVYCRSGNRSGQTIAKMEQIGFQSVEDIDGGVVAWADAGLPLVN
jgi:rhodanese-related sulfurtransferase